MNNSSSLASSSEGSSSLLSSNAALKGAFERIGCLHFSHTEGSGWDDAGWGEHDDSGHTDCPAG